MKYFKINIVVLVILLCFTQYSSASLLISPTKAIYEGRDRVKEITLINTGNKTNTYRIGWTEQKQVEDSSYVVLNAEEASSFRKASDYIRMSPKQVRLKPGERQIVKMLLRRKSNMVKGDYRSHLTFTVIPDGLEAQAQQTEPGTMGISLNLFVNYTIPVVVREGNPIEKVDILSATPVKTTNSDFMADQIKLQLARQGKYGSYGKIEVKGTHPNTGKPVLLAQLNGFNFLHENREITHFVPIINKPLFEQQSTITLNYISDVGAREVIASKYISL